LLNNLPDFRPEHPRFFILRLEKGGFGVDFMNKFFKEDNSSKNVAVERLRLVLVHDRASVSLGLMESLKEDLIAVITKYMEIDEAAMEINLNSEERSAALIANIPVKRIKR
jgi:cell division topological specificity factor